MLVAWTSDGSVGPDDSGLSVQGQRFALVDRVFADGFEAGGPGAWDVVAP